MPVLGLYGAAITAGESVAEAPLTFAAEPFAQSVPGLSKRA